MEEGEKIHIEESGLTLEQRKTKQLNRLRDSINSLYQLFGDNLIKATRIVTGENLGEEEKAALAHIPDSEELKNRIKGLIKGFNTDFYQIITSITGVQFKSIEIKKEAAPGELTADATESDTESESARLSRVPKGFNKWDLKQIKLHESTPSSGKRVWVEFWSLKGLTDVGEILYNPTKDLYYFKPHGTEITSFALTEEQGRKASAQARNYYFRVCPNPPTTEKPAS